jgi:predicted TIM-barrel fold metal-dependent hydrolase
MQQPYFIDLKCKSQEPRCRPGGPAGIRDREKPGRHAPGVFPFEAELEYNRFPGSEPMRSATMSPGGTIDFHIHIAIEEHGMWTPRVWEILHARFPETSTDMKSTMQDPARFVSYLRGQGLSGAVILAEDTVTTGLVPNEYVWEFCRRYPSFLFPFMTFNPNRMGAFQRGDEGELKENVAFSIEQMELWHRKGFRGIKEYPSYNCMPFDTELMFPFWEKAERLGLPVLFHTGVSQFDREESKAFGDPSGLSRVAESFPGLAVIIAHCGSKPYFRSAYALAKKYPNVCLELSGIPPHRLDTHFCSRGMDLDALSEKILFGTDYPAFPGGVDGIRRNIEAMRGNARSGVLQARTVERILGENARRILKLDAAGGGDSRTAPAADPEGRVCDSGPS